MHELTEAKATLYHLLLQKKNEELTHSEIDIAYALCRDPEIQAILTKAFRVKEGYGCGG